MPQTLKILLIEDFSGYVQLLTDTLSAYQNPPFELESAPSLKAGLKKIAAAKFDVILLDLNLPDSRGIDTFVSLHGECPQIPIVVLTGVDDQNMALQAVRKGAQDYLVKGDVDGKLLASVMRYAIERKRGELELRQANARSELLLSSITSILIGLDQNGTVTHWNLVAERTLETPAAGVLNRPLADCAISWDRQALLSALEECRQNKKPVRLDNLAYQRRDGDTRYLGFSIIPIPALEENTVQYLLFGADVTARKQIDQLKNDFVSTVSHELRTPLTIVQEGVSQVLDGICGPTTDMQRDTLNLCLEAIERLARIIDELLDISKIESGRIAIRREAVDLKELAQRAVAAFEIPSRQKNLPLRLVAPHGPVEVFADPDRITQVFTNLIGNAFKFTERGEIEISVSAPKAKMIECSVSDTGRGIAREDLVKAFDKFQQFGREIGPGEKGTGLGLAISKGLVEAHGGSVRIESGLGQGTRVFFTLPVKSAEELFAEQLSRQLAEAERNPVPISLLKVVPDNAAKAREAAGPEWAALTEGLHAIVKSNLRRQADFSVLEASSGTVWIVLPATQKEELAAVAARIRQIFAERFHLPLLISSAAYPDDGDNEASLLKKLEEIWPRKS
ncbi:MAG: response regulator [Candidatus Omnitrophica bacterium]|nr:response regulator [Candidatus Omnitrophota bacterium]